MIITSFYEKNSVAFAKVLEENTFFHIAPVWKSLNAISHKQPGKKIGGFVLSPSIYIYILYIYVYIIYIYIYIFIYTYIYVYVYMVSYI